MTNGDTAREAMVAEILALVELDPAPGSVELARLEELTEHTNAYECDACLEPMKGTADYA